MSALNPISTMVDALDRHEYDPRRVVDGFVARCPGHDGDGRSLHVSEGVDRRVLLHCFAHGCDPRRITEPLGLGVGDLFPAGHRRSRRRPVHHARRADFTGNARDAADMLYAVDQLGEDWRVELILRCPECGDGRALFVASTRHESFLSCPEACTVDRAAQALAGHIEDLGRAA